MIRIMSFGHVGGPPAGAFLVMDVDAVMPPLHGPDRADGRDTTVINEVMARPMVDEFVGFAARTVADSAPLRPLGLVDLAVGSATGRRRSVVVAERVARLLRVAGRRPVVVVHRELEGGDRVG